jgi:hypothetical protein
VEQNWVTAGTLLWILFLSKEHSWNRLASFESKLLPQISDTNGLYKYQYIDYF